MNEQPVDSWAVLERAGELARQGEEFALATVVWRQGPSSGQQGSRAIVTRSGDVHGWIGGACAEPVVIREAQRAIVDGESRLLLLGDPGQFGAVPEGMTVIPISCQSEGAMEVYIEPVRATPRLLVVGRSPMAHALCDLAKVIGWHADVVDSSEFASSDLDPRTFVVVASQGTGDEDAIERAVVARPAYIGLVASHRRGESVLGYLADRGVATELLDRVHVPAGLDLGHTTHTEIAVAILAELVQLKAAGALTVMPGAVAAAVPAAPPTAVDPVCGMTVAADDTTRPFVHEGVTYHFCGAGCRAAFEKDPAAHLRKETPC
jgi:xanthine dehydrogenase accessory factor